MGLMPGYVGPTLIISGGIPIGQCTRTYEETSAWSAGLA